MLLNRALASGLLLTTAAAMSAWSGQAEAGVIVTFETNAGTFKVELYDDTPIARDNFLQYINDGLFLPTLIHRSVPNFVIQGGGFHFDDEAGFEPVAPKEYIVNNPVEGDPFELQHSNVRGTIAMAENGLDGTYTSQWFVNVDDNDFLDDSYTVFGEVIEGMDVVDFINSLPTSLFVQPYDVMGNEVPYGQTTQGDTLVYANITVPEPASLSLVALGSLCLVRRRRSA